MALTDITGSFGPTAFEASPSTGGVYQSFNFASNLPSLTADQQEALLGRRRAASRGVEQTQNVVQREAQRAQGDALRQQRQLTRDFERASREGMQTLAGRGVARSPMFVNPFQRQLVEQSQRQIGELRSGLAGTLSQLENALRQAEIGREAELSQIDFDALTYRSDIDRLLGA